MPSSLIFASLVVVWLLILLPTIARRRQDVPRTTQAAPSGRVLARPVRQRTEEVDEVPQTDAFGGVDVRPDAPNDVRAASDEIVTRWERPEPRYRPGRGGFDPAAAALAARARYAFRQRVVLTLLVLAGLTAAGALLLGSALWWVHVAVDVLLVGYLGYLRRQVRLEEAIRQRRAARMAGTRRAPAAEDTALDEWARRGRAAATGGTGADECPAPADPDDATRLAEGHVGEDAAGETPDPGVDAPAPVDADSADPTDADASDADPAEEPALPRLRPAPPPSLPLGMTLLGADDLDPDLPAFDPSRRPYRRAAGQ